MPEFKNQGNIFGAAIDRPFHLSVGVVVLNAENDILCLHYPDIDGQKDIFVLPNKTAKPSETLVDTATRAAKQELGCDIRLVTFLGSTRTEDSWWGELGTPTKVEKNVLYFLAVATQQHPDIAKNENEKEGREVTTKTFGFLIERMNNIALKDGMRDFNHAEIVIRAQKWLASHPDLQSSTL